MNNLNCTNCGADNSSNSKYCKQCGFELPKPKVEIVEAQVKPHSQPQDKKNKIIITIIGIIAFGLSYWAVHQFLFRPPSFDKVLMEVASELNKTCPIMINNETRLDNAIALPNNTFQYNYTLLKLTKAEINIDTVKKYIEPGILNNMRTNPEMKIYRDNKTTMIYYYKDKNGEFAHKFTITPDMY